MAKKVNSINSVSPSEVYAGGTLSPISTTELKDNEVAIRQLLNNYNILQKELKEANVKNQQVESELAISKISPFVAVFAAIVNVIGTVLIAVGASLEGDGQACLFWLLIIAGATCILIANIATICYKYVAQWLTKK